MHKTILLLAITIFMLLAGKAYSAKEDLVFFDLPLAGYRIGMTYDEARAEHIYVDDIEMDLWVYFIDEKIQKINGLFDPSAI